MAMQCLHLKHVTVTTSSDVSLQMYASLPSLFHSEFCLAGLSAAVRFDLPHMNYTELKQREWKQISHA